MTPQPDSCWALTPFSLWAEPLPVGLHIHLPHAPSFPGTGCPSLGPWLSLTGALACPLSFLPAHRAAAAGTPCPGPLASEFSALFGGNLWLPLTLVSQSVCFCFLFSLPLFHACWLPCSSLPPFSPPLPDHPIFPCRFLGGAQVRTWKGMTALRSDPTSCRLS